MANSYPGLAIGTIGFRSNSVVNAIASIPIVMGSAVQLVTPPDNELLPRVAPTDKVGALIFGIVVQGDSDGIYGEDLPPLDINRAAIKAGDTVAVCTQGRCLARVEGAVALGEGLMTDIVPAGSLVAFVDTAINNKVGITLIAQADDGLTVVDIQREGLGDT